MFISQTPLRISFVGGGTDFPDFYLKHGGAVLSSAIDKYIFVIVKERFDDKIVVNYSSKEIVDSVDQIKHELVREAMKLVGVEKGIEITTLADIPAQGTGLGSSSTVTVGLLNALYAYIGETHSAEWLAREACKIEIDIAGPVHSRLRWASQYHLRLRRTDRHRVGGG
jgi:D-glycero-alpha-D-manno-heptose-7-phosphate kinase